MAEIDQSNPDWDAALNSEFCDNLYQSEETLFRALSAIEDPDFVPNPDDPSFAGGR